MGNGQTLDSGVLYAIDGTGQMRLIGEIKDIEIVTMPAPFDHTSTEAEG